MIGRLRGVVDAVEEQKCLIDVNGVGYVVFASGRTLSALPDPPAIASLLIETQVREDAITLYGFASGAERDWFRLLNTVQGVGAKVALGLLSAFAPDQLGAAIAGQDKAMLARAPGVGARLAARIAAELREKVGAMPDAGPPLAPAHGSGSFADALSALTHLGYRRAEAEAALARAVAEQGAGASLEVLVRAGLKALAR